MFVLVKMVFTKGKVGLSPPNNTPCSAVQAVGGSAAFSELVTHYSLLSVSVGHRVSEGCSTHPAKANLWAGNALVCGGSMWH
ncbi:hypothetical protein AOLI_G00056840 [Acnodon oligacanthus]